jgi:hypothetical protein
VCVYVCVDVGVCVFGACVCVRVWLCVGVGIGVKVCGVYVWIVVSARVCGGWCVGVFVGVCRCVCVHV